MKKELKIVVPNGYEIDKENSTFEKIVFKEIDSKPKSFEEYLCSGNHPNKLWFIDPARTSTGGIGSTRGNLKDCDLNNVTYCYMGAYLPSKESAESFIAMMQLVSLRQSWVGDWKPDWTDFSDKWCIVNSNNKLIISNYIRIVRVLSFPTKKMVNEFMDCFWGLLEIAKPLI